MMKSYCGRDMLIASEDIRQVGLLKNEEGEYFFTGCCPEKLLGITTVEDRCVLSYKSLAYCIKQYYCLFC